jgi:DNA polymerase II small subunit/DNA polymerase delta subunit B
MSYLKELIKLGFLVKEDAVDRVKSLDEKEFEKLIDFLKKEKTFILSKNLIKRILREEIRILKTFNPAKSYSINDFVNMLNQRYDSLQKILVKKLELKNVVSINKCSRGVISVIGLVKEIEEKRNDFIVKLEDPTGELQAVIAKNLTKILSLDDVVALFGNFRNKILFTDKLLFPDVPLRSANYSKDMIKVAFITGDKKCDADYCVYIDKIKDNIKNKVYEITNPSIVEIGGLIILIMHGFDPFNVLKKRYVSIEKTDFIIEPIPDVLFTDKNVNTNYKGISIVSSGSIIDLKTRDMTNI